MTDRNREVEGMEGVVIDDGTTAELLQDKNIGEDVLRADTKANEANPNDQPGFNDGQLGGFDGEDRQGEPNSEGGHDTRGEQGGGIGTERSGGVDGGPARTRPLPGKDGK